MPSLEERVKKEVLKTGLPTEIMSTEMLRNAGWLVNNECPYLDKDENKIRTLDITATKTFFRNKLKIKNTLDKTLTCELYIECKKSTKQSWVFYTENFPKSYTDYMLQRLFHDLNSDLSNAIHKGTKKPINIFCQIPFTYENMSYKIAMSQQNIFNKKNEFYEGTMQVLKALRHKNEENKKKPQDSSIPTKVIPIILFDGHIFECYYDQKELITPEIEYTRYLTQGLPNQRIPALIDVMTLDYFPKYLEEIENEFNYLLIGKAKIKL